MKRSTVLTENNRATWATAFAVVIVLPLVFSILGLAMPDDPERPQVFLEDVDPQWENCVRDSSYMRFRHMDVLKEIRSEVIREGLKGGITLAGCGDCHLNRDQFCDKCHQVANVILDCWGCHYYLTAEELAELGH